MAWEQGYDAPYVAQLDGIAVAWNLTSWFTSLSVNWENSHKAIELVYPVVGLFTVQFPTEVIQGTKVLGESKTISSWVNHFSIILFFFFFCKPEKMLYWQCWQTDWQMDKADCLTHIRDNKYCSTYLISLLNRPRCHLSLFQVGLSIDIGSLNVTHSVGIAGVEQKDVCRNHLITRELNKVTQLYPLPLLTHKCSCFPNKKREDGGRDHIQTQCM